MNNDFAINCFIGDLYHGGKSCDVFSYFRTRPYIISKFNTQYILMQCRYLVAPVASHYLRAVSTYDNLEQSQKVVSYTLKKDNVSELYCPKYRHKISEESHAMLCIVYETSKCRHVLLHGTKLLLLTTVAHVIRALFFSGFVPEKKKKSCLNRHCHT